MHDPTPFATRSKLLSRYRFQVREIRDGGDPFPVAMEVNLSNFCAQNCRWCINGNSRSRGSFLDVTAPQVETFLCDFKNLGGACVGWSGGGDPTHHPNFDQALALVSSVGLPQGLITHGAFRATLVESIARQCAWTRISLDTCDRASYAEHRGTHPNSFDFVLENVRALVEAGGYVGVNMNVGEWNKEKIEAVYDLACELKANYFQIRLIIDSPFLQSSSAAFLDKGSIKSVICQARSLVKEKTNRGVKIIVSYDKFFELMSSNYNPKYPGCRSHRLFFVLNHNGDVMVCMYHLNDNRFRMGSIYHDRLEEIWHSKKRKAVLAFCDNQKGNGLNHWKDRCQLICKGHEINKILFASEIEYSDENSAGCSPFL